MGHLISVIIPVFNRFEYAQRAVDSVLQQTYSNWELIIVDDESIEVFSHYVSVQDSNNKIEIYRIDKNSGAGYCRQFGLDRINGDFVCFLDSDDYYHTDFLQKMVNTLVNYPEHAGVYCTSFDLMSNSVRKNSNVSFNKILPFLFDENRPWATCSWLWRREYISKWPVLRSNEDTYFEISVAMKNNQIVHLPEILCYIDKDTGSNTIDSIGINKNEKDRNFVVKFCLENIRSFCEDQNLIYNSCLRRFFYTSARLIKINSLLDIRRNILFLLDIKEYKLSLILFLFMILACFNNNMSYRICEKYRLTFMSKY
jgi:glycosyltransferase involved in cell wall biosynthesis